MGLDSDFFQELDMQDMKILQRPNCIMYEMYLT